MGMLIGIDWHSWLIGACRVWIKLVKRFKKIDANTINKLSAIGLIREEEVAVA